MSISEKDRGKRQEPETRGRECDERLGSSVQCKTDYAGVLDRVFQRVLLENSQIEGQRGVVPDLLDELRNLSTAQRRLLMENSSRFRGWAIAEGLLRYCSSLWLEDPAGAEDYALLATEIIERTEAVGFRTALLHDLNAEAWSFVANCRRIRSDLTSAQEAFDRAETLLTTGSGDPMERARLSDLKSSLLRAQRDFDGAAELLSYAVRQYRINGDCHLEGRALIKSAKLLHDMGRVEHAIPLLRRAKNLVDVHREPRSLFLIQHNLVMYLAETGMTEEARSLVPSLRKLAKAHARGYERLRVLWVEGVVSKSCGQLEIACEALEQAREGFIAGGLSYDVALVSLEIASIYLSRGRTQAVRQLAVETMPLFAAQGIDRELFMAWSLFHQAANRDVATLQLIDDVARQVRSLSAVPLGAEPAG